MGQVDQSVHCPDLPEHVAVRVERAEPAVPVMRVVASGVASRWDARLDVLDDVQLAIETLLAEEPQEGSDFILALGLENDDLKVWIDGLTYMAVKRVLSFDAASSHCQGCLLNVRLVLESLVDAYRVVDTGVHTFAVEMAKRAW